MSEFFAAALIRRKKPKGIGYQFLILYYQPAYIHPDGRREKVGKLQIKFPGGRKEFPSETPKKCARREVLIETGGLIIRGATEVGTIPTAEDHTQHFFLVDYDRCKGKKKFNMQMIREEAHSDVGPFEWVDEDKVERILFHTHQAGFRKYKEKNIALALVA